MKPTYKILTFVFLLLISLEASALLCKSWGKPTEVGKLAANPINEQSGMAASSKFPRLYHNNDSGDYANLYITDLSGKLIASTTYNDQFPLDVEELGIGKCNAAEDKKCLYFGDIGDNFGIRPSLVFRVVEEIETWPAKTKTIRTLNVRYPEGRHDAEAFALHPSGDLILITKAYSGAKALKSTVFKLQASKVFAGGDHTFTKIGELDIPKLVGSHKGTNVATGMSISPDGSGFLVLTYNDVLEFSLDLSKQELPTTLRVGTDFQVIKVPKLPQTEAITYSSDGRSFFYSTEARRQILMRPNEVPLMQVKCVSI